MTIDDEDLFDLAVWIAWKKHMIALSLDEYGFRRRRGFRTALLFALAAAAGFRWGGNQYSMDSEVRFCYSPSNPPDTNKRQLLEWDVW
jgi:hypothetical protein